MSAYLITEADGCVEVPDNFNDPYEPLAVRISNPAAENGYDQEPGPLTWLNSARITADPDDDAVHCVVSVGDPRGGFCFTVRRLSDGRLVIHTPHPGEGMPHCVTVESHPGTLTAEGDFSDEEPEHPDTCPHCGEGLPVADDLQEQGFCDDCGQALND